MNPLPSRATASANYPGPRQACPAVGRPGRSSCVGYRLEEPGASKPTARPIRTPTATRAARPLARRDGRRRCRAARGDSQCEGDDRCDDAVVEAALNVEHAAHLHRYPLVVDHLRAQRSVGRRQGRTDKACERPRQIVEEPGREQGPEHHRQRKPDAEEPCREPDVASELVDVHPGGVGEQQQREGHLRDHVDRRGLEVHREGPPVRVRKREPSDREDQRAVDVGARKHTGDHCPPQDEQCGYGERRFCHCLCVHPVSASSGRPPSSQACAARITLSGGVPGGPS